MRISELELQVEMLQAARDKVSDDKLALETEVEHLRNINLSQRCQLAERSTILGKFFSFDNYNKSKILKLFKVKIFILFSFFFK